MSLGGVLPARSSVSGRGFTCGADVFSTLRLKVNSPPEAERLGAPPFSVRGGISGIRTMGPQPEGRRQVARVRSTWTQRTPAGRSRAEASLREAVLSVSSASSKGPGIGASPNAASQRSGFGIRLSVAASPVPSLRRMRTTAATTDTSAVRRRGFTRPSETKGPAEAGPLCT
jgi:hypothetical protein